MRWVLFLIGVCLGVLIALLLNLNHCGSLLCR